LISDFGDGSGLSWDRRWQRHCQRCPPCAEWREQQRQLERRLKISAATGATPPVPHRLATRVAAEVASAERQLVAGSPAGGWRFPARAATLVVLVGLLGMLGWNPPFDGPRDPTPEASVTGIEGIRARVALPDAERLLAANDLVERPLLAEMEALQADARAATEYLSRSLLPADLLAVLQR
jgi:hypothetical protein